MASNKHESGNVDKITVEVIRNYLVTVADEMKKVIERTAMSPIIYEVLDFSTGVFTRDARLMGQAAGLTSFLGTLDLAVAATLEKFGADDLHPGDLIITNDPYTGGGTHLNDVVTVSPIFYQQQLIGFSAVRAHWIDLGGKVPFSQMSDATEIFQEGLLFPVVKLYVRGQRNEALYEVIQSNVRLPRSLAGDLQAQIAACRIGERRIHELLDRYGVAQFDASVEQLMENTEALVRARLREMPDGVARAEDWHDSAGPDGDPIRICVRVTKENDTLFFDFTGSDPATASSLNQGWGAFLSSCRAIFKCVTQPQEAANDGSFRPLRVHAPVGSCLNVQRPSPVCMYGELGRRVMDAAWKAMATLWPDRLPAGHYSTVAAQGIAGYDTDAETGRYFMFGGPNGGGWGAGRDHDGENALICLGNGDTRNTPMEVIEAKYPLVVQHYALRTDSGGAGRFRGGLGLSVAYEVRRGEQLTAVFVCGRCKFAPFGLHDGQDGSTNSITVLRDGVRGPCTCQAAGLPLAANDVIAVETGGGGGFGDPVERDSELIRRDLLLGYVSNKAAQRVYNFNHSS